MLEILQFIFSSFWVFLGTLMLLALLLKIIAVIVLGAIALITGGKVNL